MDIDELKLVLANIDEILNNDDLKIIMDGNDIDENQKTEFEGEYIGYISSNFIFNFWYLYLKLNIDETNKYHYFNFLSWLENLSNMYDLFRN